MQPRFRIGWVGHPAATLGGSKCRRMTVSPVFPGDVGAMCPVGGHNKAPLQCGIAVTAGEIEQHRLPDRQRHDQPTSSEGEVARETGLEPATSGVTGRRSNQLSYSRSSGLAAQRGVRLEGSSGIVKQQKPQLRTACEGSRKRGDLPLEVPLREGPAGARFQVTFEGERFFFRLEGRVGAYRPRHELGCVRDRPRIVSGEAFSQVLTAADVGLLLVVQRLQDVHVVHRRRLARRAKLPSRLPAFGAQLWRFINCGSPAEARQREGWWAVTVSNRRPSRCKRDALPTELTARHPGDEAPGNWA